MKLRTKALIAFIVFASSTLGGYLGLSKLELDEGKVTGRILKIEQNTWSTESWDLTLFVKGELIQFSVTDSNIVEELLHYDGKYVEIFYKKYLFKGLRSSNLKAYAWRSSKRVAKKNTLSKTMVLVDKNLVCSLIGELNQDKELLSRFLEYVKVRNARVFRKAFKCGFSLNY